MTHVPAVLEFSLGNATKVISKKIIPKEKIVSKEKIVLITRMKRIGNVDWCKCRKY